MCLGDVSLFLQLLIHIAENIGEGDFFHPSLIDIGFHGATETLQMLIGMVDGDKNEFLVFLGQL